MNFQFETKINFQCCRIALNWIDLVFHQYFFAITNLYGVPKNCTHSKKWVHWNSVTCFHTQKAPQMKSRSGIWRVVSLVIFSTFCSTCSTFLWTAPDLDVNSPLFSYLKKREWPQSLFILFNWMFIEFSASSYVLPFN